MSSPRQGLLQRAGPDNRGAYQLVPENIAIDVDSPTGDQRSAGRTESQSSPARTPPPLDTDVCEGSAPVDTGGAPHKRIRQTSVLRDHSLQQTAWQHWGKEVLEGNIVQSLTVVLIISNAIIVGLETDVPGYLFWDIMETVFLVFFSAELLMRIFTFRTYFFNCMTNPDFLWNMIDFTIVSAGFFTSCIVVLLPQTGAMSNDATLFRTVRLLRILRILRVVRVFRFLKQLYLLAYGFVEGANAVFWVATLATCIIYVCAVVLVRVYRHEDNEFIQTRFSSIPTTMFTLFEIMSDPSLQMYRQEIFDYPVLIGFIIVYIIFGSFGINGLLTGVISESILEKNQARMESHRMDRESKRRDLMKECSELFHQMDEEDSGSLTAEDIMDFEPEIRQIFQNSGTAIPDYDLGRMLEVMDYDGNGFIEKSEFINGILELCEDIRPMSIMELHSAVARANGRIARISSGIELLMQSFEDLAADLHARHGEVASAGNLMTKLCLLLESKGVQGAQEVGTETMQGVMADFKNAVSAHEAAKVKASPRSAERAQARRRRRSSPGGKLAAASDRPEVKKKQGSTEEAELQQASKSRADELLAQVAGMQVQSPTSGLSRQVSSGTASVASYGEMSPEAQSLHAPAGETDVAKSIRDLLSTRNLGSPDAERDMGVKQSTLLQTFAEPKTTATTSGNGSVALEVPIQPANDCLNMPTPELAEANSPVAHDIPGSEAYPRMHIFEIGTLSETPETGDHQNSASSLGGL